jgi:hypothetical protein
MAHRLLSSLSRTMGEVWRPARFGAVLLLAAFDVGCTLGAPSTFTLDSASVDPSFVCPNAADNLAYNVHATIDVRNGTSSAVTVRSVAVVMTLAAVKGGWLEHVGDKYEAGDLPVSPTTIGSGSSASLKVTIPSACTNGKNPTSGASYGEYSVIFTVATSSGTHTIASQNRHRIVAA